MKTKKNDVIKNLKLLIDISCVKGEYITVFKLFHKMLIRISYEAADVSIDDNRKPVYMHVIAEYKYYNLDTIDHVLAPLMSVNLVYEDLNTFLKTCILEDTESLNIITQP